MPRLSDRDWLNAGLKTLAHSGFAALKAAPMAQMLGVSRGSFYWHFKDIGDFQERLLRHWQDKTTDAIIAELDMRQHSKERLPDLMARAYAAKPQLDNAIRVWAQNHTLARKYVAKVDKLRIDYIVSLLIAAGLDDAKARPRARFLYAASLGDPAIAIQAAAHFHQADLEDLARLLVQE
ncbi:MAG: TetR/AcrR family transcriptional regulator [Pseudomonadota bacterium]